MNRLLALLLACALVPAAPQARAQSLSIGPGGISFSSAPGQPALKLDINKSGLRLSAAPSRTTLPVRTASPRTVRCSGAGVTVRGSRQRLTLLGSCAQLSVTGSQNVITVERVGRIQIQGSRNTVLWKVALGGSSPSLRLSGSGNTVQGTRPRPSAVTITPPNPTKLQPRQPAPQPAPRIAAPL